MKEIASIIRKAKKDKSVLAVILYGSVARKQPARDVDICIVLHPQSKSSIFKRLQYTPTSEKYDVHIFQSLPLYVQQRILAEGKVLYCRNRSALYDLAFQIIREFDLFEPHYRSYLMKVAHG